jgi:preprotein translocase subunit SecF
MGSDRPYVAEYARFLREFGDLEYAWIVVDAKGNLGQAEHAVDLLARALRHEPTIDAVNAVVSVPEQMQLATWSMSTPDLAGLVESRDALPLLASDAGTGAVLDDALRRMARLKAEGLWMPRSEAERIGAAAVLELQAIAAAAPDAPPFVGAPAVARYLESPSGRLRLVGVMPHKDFTTFEVIDRPLAAIRAAIEEVSVAVPEVEIGLTGKPVLQSDELATTSTDMNLASVVGLVLCTLLFMAVFRGVRLPLMALAAFLVACALTYAAAALFFGRLNLLSIVFMLVLVGVGLDYGIHMVARYIEARRHLGVHDSVVHMMRTAVPSNTSGALTSAGVFLLAWFTEFQGLRELGVVSGVGLLLALGCMVLVLPALLVIFDGHLKKARSAVPDAGSRAYFLRNEPESRRMRPGRALVIVAVSAVTATLAGWYGLSHLRFESNLLKLQAVGLPSVEWEHRLMADSAAASWFGASIVERMDQIPPLVQRLRAHPEIGEIRTVLDAVELETPERAALRAQFASAVESAPVRPRTVPPWSHADLARAADDVDLLARFAQSDAPEEAREMRELAARLRTLVALLSPAHHSPADVAAMRAHVDETVARAARGLRLMAEGARRPLRDALPAAVRAQMMSPNGKFLVMIHPAEDVWHPGALDAYVTAMRAEDPHATGVPMTVSESMASMERSFALQAILATLLVVLLLWLDFRSMLQSAVALLSLAVGVAWTAGAMALLGATFNLANFFAVPILIGLGIDSAIHMTHRAHEGALDHGFGSTRRAVIVTALTTTIGFGALLLAHHQGLRSLGVAMGVGSVCCLISSVWTLPALLRVIRLHPRHAELRLAPIEEAPSGRAPLMPPAAAALDSPAATLAEGVSRPASERRDTDARRGA